jgi:hypothetical protein
MSYVRWGTDGSQVYVFANSAGYVECCGCSFEFKEVTPYKNALGWEVDFEMGSAELHSAAEVVEHMQQHRDAGEQVPDYMFDETMYEPEDFMPYQPQQ